ncbi:DNA repair protein RadC [Myxococcaceae bacterium GXIMD 01537]
MEAWAEAVEVGGSAGDGSVRPGPGWGVGTRERLFRLGASALTDPELLGVVLGPGARTRRLTEALLEGRGGLKGLYQRDPLELCGQLGPPRVARLLAALELGRRARRATEKRPRLRDPRDIYRYLEPTLGALRREVFHVLSFNARNTLLHDARVAEGTPNTCPVDPREVFAAALGARATAVVLAHNHPSGDPEPSAQDVSLTARLCAAGRLLGIHVLDHVVVGDAGFVSMAERGYLRDEEARRWDGAGGGM